MTDNLFGPPDLFTARRILAVQPHYDDNDIAAGGTLAVLAEQGAEIHYLTVTDDLVGVIDQTLTDKQMTGQLRHEQKIAGEIIGVHQHYWLDYPDAGKYDTFEVRRDIIQHIRTIRPDFVFICDPWLPYEAHNDHIQAGKATVEAVTLYSHLRLKTTDEVDGRYEPFEITGIAFYASAYPNTIVDISETRKKKHQALDTYQAQFSTDELAQLHLALDLMEQKSAAGKDFTHAESLKVLRPGHLHVYPEAVRT